MGIKQSLKKFISTFSETTETHEDESLKTRYYKGMKDKVQKEVYEFFEKESDFVVKSNSTDHGEIIVDGLGNKKVFIVASIIMIAPNKTAIDFSVTTETSLPTDFGHSAKLIRYFYKEMDKRLDYIGSGLGT